jgi:inactivated superfamily I helicase
MAVVEVEVTRGQPSSSSGAQAAGPMTAASSTDPTGPAAALLLAAILALGLVAGGLRARDAESE